MTDSISNWRRQHDQTSNSIKQNIGVIMLYSLFCIITLGKSDEHLLSTSASIILPFANVGINYRFFLVVSPIILMLLSLNFQILLANWTVLSSKTPNTELPLPYVFNTPGPLPRLVNFLVMQMAVPIVLLAFTWKALPRTEGAYLFYATVVYSIWQLLYIAYARINEISYRIENLISILFSAVLLCLAILTATGNVSLTRTINLNKAKFKDMEISNIDLSKSNAQDAVFERVSFRGVDLTLANLTGAKFVNVGIQDVSAVGAILNDATFENVSIADSDFSESKSHRAKFKDSSVTNVLFRKSEISDSEYSNVTFKSVDFSYSLFSSSRFIKIIATDFILHNSNISDVDFKAATLKNVHFSDSTWVDNSFESTVFSQCVAFGVDLQSRQFKNVKFLNCLSK